MKSLLNTTGAEVMAKLEAVARAQIDIVAGTELYPDSAIKNVLDEMRGHFPLLAPDHVLAKRKLSNAVERDIKFFFGTVGLKGMRKNGECMYPYEEYMERGGGTSRKMKYVKNLPDGKPGWVYADTKI